MNLERSVLKFGGSSVSDFTKIKNIAEMLSLRIAQGEQLIVVVSAMGKTTDELMANVSTLTTSPKDQELALLLTTGEQQTVSYLSMVLNDIGVRAKAMTGYQAGIKTVGHHLKSRIAEINPETFEQAFEENDVLVVAGFQGINDDLEVTTLGRGGSDTTAVALAASNHTPCEIYTDVDGVYATDPRLYKDAKRLDYVSYEEMMEMSALGAGVLETRSVELANNYNIPLYLGRTLSNVKGTWIMPQTEILEKKAVTGVALDTHMMHVTISYPLPDNKLLTKLFSQLEDGSVNVDMISQIVNLEGLQMSFTIKDTDVAQISSILETLKEDFSALDFRINEEYVKISLIGSGMRDMSGVASKAFITLIENDISFYQTTTSEISISCVIDAENGERAVQTLYQAFDI
ncbi:aspartate kinase [Staphylococcus saprophyticus]|jgi:aspartate kinase|uniref:Aspartokinase n=6 Tax=Staphylococcus saprophyticus TaxID=29385 RepID=Q49XJ5_STAS1|nr:MULTISPECIES: aspartate kinase [Staphylococcus]CRV19701.1 aspartate kinase [Streptococcus equi subsp. equi]MBC2920911.1 aspartate kinase [Staphylococcus saprophyticus]MBC2956615.1 aspartate kinase [Staphylococcus saprophyticus]MBC3009263.1 aspartate kinase [Staphylococcus saprophyticus]MBC3023142.1 aspartate kinase [Staphylococcus saprophyticus]